MEDDFDPYRVLGVPVGADEATVRRRYRALVRKHHPDVSADSDNAHQRFVRIQEAYRVLMDPDQRARWERRAGFVGVAGPQVVFTRPGTRFEQRLTEARSLLRQRKLRRAHEAAAEAIELNPFSAEAYQVMGDIYLAGGRNAMAQEMYDEAKRLEGRPSTRRVNPSDPIPMTPVHTPGAARPAVRVPVLVTGLVGVAICLAFMAMADFAARPFAFAAWGVAAAFLLGLGGAASGALEPVDELVGLASVSEPGRGAAPGALYLLVLSLLSPYLGLVYYVLSSIITETRARSIVKVYAATFAVFLVAWLSVRGGLPGYFPLVAPSIAFAAVLAGWIAGSFAAPGEWWRR